MAVFTNNASGHRCCATSTRSELDANGAARSQSLISSSSSNNNNGQLANDTTASSTNSAGQMTPAASKQSPRRLNQQRAAPEPHRRNSGLGGDKLEWRVNYDHVAHRDIGALPKALQLQQQRRPRESPTAATMGADFDWQQQQHRAEEQASRSAAGSCCDRQLHVNDDGDDEPNKQKQQQQPHTNQCNYMAALASERYLMSPSRAARAQKSLGAGQELACPAPGNRGGRRTPTAGLGGGGEHDDDDEDEDDDHAAADGRPELPASNRRRRRRHVNYEQDSSDHPDQDQDQELLRVLVSRPAVASRPRDNIVFEGDMDLRTTFETSYEALAKMRLDNWRRHKRDLEAARAPPRGAQAAPRRPGPGAVASGAAPATRKSQPLAGGDNKSVEADVEVELAAPRPEGGGVDGLCRQRQQRLGAGNANEASNLRRHQVQRSPEGARAVKAAAPSGPQLASRAADGGTNNNNDPICSSAAANGRRRQDQSCPAGQHIDADLAPIIVYDANMNRLERVGVRKRSKYRPSTSLRAGPRGLFGDKQLSSEGGAAAADQPVQLGAGSSERQQQQAAAGLPLRGAGVSNESAASPNCDLKSARFTLASQEQNQQQQQLGGANMDQNFPFNSKRKNFDNINMTDNIREQNIVESPMPTTAASRSKATSTSFSSSCSSSLSSPPKVSLDSCLQRPGNNYARRCAAPTTCECHQLELATISRQHQQQQLGAGVSNEAAASLPNCDQSFVFHSKRKNLDNINMTDNIREQNIVESPMPTTSPAGRSRDELHQLEVDEIGHQLGGTQDTIRRLVEAEEVAAVDEIRRCTSNTPHQQSFATRSNQQKEQQQQETLMSERNPSDTIERQRRSAATGARGGGGSNSNNSNYSQTDRRSRLERTCQNQSFYLFENEYPEARGGVGTIANTPSSGGGDSKLFNSKLLEGLGVGGGGDQVADAQLLMASRSVSHKNLFRESPDFTLTTSAVGRPAGLKS